jgi:hypothetical protein
VSWNHGTFRNNLLDYRGVSALIDHLPSLFPRLACGIMHNIIGFTFIDDNPISSEMKMRLEEELKRRREEVSCSVHVLLWNTMQWIIGLLSSNHIEA